MVPTLEPFLALYAGLLSAHSPLLRFTRQMLVVAPFGLVWIATGAVAWVLLVLSEDDAVARGLLVAIAGAYQLSPLARACLGRCRSPMAFLMRYGAMQRTPGDAVALGSRYALICVGCCAGLWIALVGAGAMGLAWMAALALLVLVEKWHASGEVFARVAGAALLLLALPTAFGADIWTERAGLIALLAVGTAAVVTVRSRTVTA